MVDRYFPQKCTWWARSVSDGYGGVLFTAPVIVNCRWEDKQVLFRNRNGVEEMSSSIAYVDKQLEIGDYLILGNWLHTQDPTLVDAQEIKQYSEIPDLRGLKTERKAIM